MARIKSNKWPVQMIWWLQLATVAFMLLRVWLRQTMFYENYGMELPVSPIIEVEAAVFYFPVLGLLQSIRQYLELNTLTDQCKDLLYEGIHKGILYIKMIVWLGFAVFIASNVFVYNNEVFPPTNAMDVFFLIIPISLIEGFLLLLKYLHDRTRKNQFCGYLHQKTDWLDMAWLIINTVVRAGMLIYVVIHWIHLNATGQWETVWHHFGEILNGLYPLSVIYVIDLLMQRRWMQRIYKYPQMLEFDDTDPLAKE